MNNVIQITPVIGHSIPWLVPPPIIGLVAYSPQANNNPWSPQLWWNLADDAISCQVFSNHNSQNWAVLHYTIIQPSYYHICLILIVSGIFFFLLTVYQSRGKGVLKHFCDECSSFCYIELHAKFHNSRINQSGRKLKT